MSDFDQAIKQSIETAKKDEERRRAKNPFSHLPSYSSIRHLTGVGPEYVPQMIHNDDDDICREVDKIDTVYRSRRYSDAPPLPVDDSLMMEVAIFESISTPVRSPLNDAQKIKAINDQWYALVDRRSALCCAVKENLIQNPDDLKRAKDEIIELAGAIHALEMERDKLHSKLALGIPRDAY